MNSQLTIEDMVLRLGMAFFSGLIIGFERESHGRAAGFRTTILTCVASALAMIISEMVFVDATGSSNAWKPDPARLAAGVLTGMGFLGGAGIIRHENAVRGVTTAAVLWYVTMLGLAFGSGHFYLGQIGLILALLTLFVLPRFEARIRSDWYSMLKVKTKLGVLTKEELFGQIEALGTTVRNSRIEYDFENQSVTIFCEVKFKKQDFKFLSDQIIERVIRFPGVLHVSWS